MLSRGPDGVLPDGRHCPSCGSALEREHRHVLDRWVSLFQTVHRYRCTNPGCAWEGLLGRQAKRGPSAPAWRTRLVWFLVGAGCALAAVQGARLYVRAQAAEQQAHAALRRGVEAQSRATPPGVDFAGEVLPEQDERVAHNRSPLTLRRSCAWGVPGGNPYRGTVQQALAAARLPPEVVRQVGDMVDRGWIRGQVEISSTGIRTVDGRREFGNSITAMAFGNTLCFETRINFKPGHVEYASLYEANDERGQTYTIMVPYVCQNVSVLGARGEINGTTAKVPEPATWTMLGLALGLLAWTRRRRRHRGSP